MRSTRAQKIRGRNAHPLIARLQEKKPSSFFDFDKLDEPEVVNIQEDIIERPPGLDQSEARKRVAERRRNWLAEKNREAEEL